MQQPNGLSGIVVGWVRLLACLALLLGAVVLCGWQLDIPWLQSLSPGMVAMMPNTALSFVFSGMVLFLQTLPDLNKSVAAPRWAGIALVLVVSLSTQSEYLFGCNLGIDQLLFRDSAGGQADAIYPGRFSIHTAYCFILLSSALGLAETERYPNLLQGMAAAACFLALWKGGGYLWFKLENLDIYDVRTYADAGNSSNPMALHTMLGLVLLGVAVLLNNSALGFAARLRKTLPLLGVGVALILLALASGMTFYGMKQSRAATDWVKHAYRVVDRLDAAALSLWAFRDNIHGFLADGQAYHETAAGTIRAKLLDELGAITLLTGDNAVQWRGLTDLHPILDRCLAAADELTRIRRGQGLEAALRDATALQLDELSIELLSRIEGLKAAELSLLRIREQGHEKKDNLTAAMVIISTLIILLLLAVLLGLQREIAQRHANEKRLQETESRLRAFFTTSAIGIVIHDERGNIVECNQAGARLFNWPDEELAGQNIKGLMPESCRGHYDAYLKNHLPGGGSEIPGAGLELLGLRKDRTVFPMELSAGQANSSGKRIFVGFIQDISARKRMEAQTRQFRAIVTSSSDAIIGKSLEGVVTSWNPAAELLFGYGETEMIGRSIMLIFPPEKYDEERSFMEKLRAGERVNQYETVRIRKEGDPIPVSVSLSPILDDSGGIVGVASILRDIGRQKQAEMAIRESEERMLLATEATGVGIWEWNIVTNKIRWNAQMFRIYGMAPTADGFIRYDAWSDCVLPEELVRQEELMHGTIRRLGRGVREFRIRRADDGRRRHIHAVETVRLNANGKAEWLVGTNLDVTERKLAEESLRKYIAQLKIFINRAPIAIAMLDRDMNYLATSDRWLEDYGRGLTDLSGRNHYQVNPDLPEAWKRIHQQGLAGATLKNDEDLWIHDGKQNWLRWSVTPWIDENDAIGGIIISAEDITGRKLNETQLADQARQLAENDRRKDDFLAMLAHELRNPLAPIRNAVEIQKHPNIAPSRAAWCVDMIDRQLKQLTGLVDDLLDVARISRGAIEFKKEPLEIRDIVVPAVETNQPLIDARRQTLDLTLPKEPLWIEGDRIRLAQIVSNLINNAAKYTGEEGRIWLTVEQKGGDMLIRVADNGCGIDSADLPNLFNLFYQADRNLDRSEGGLGIGLSIVQKLASMHGGEVRAFSAGRGQGSEFVVRLPRLILAAPAIAETAAMTLPGKLRILVVEDNRDITDSMALLLEIEGHQARICYDAETALQVARADPFDAIFVDIGLPGMDGLDLARELKGNPALNRTLLVALTGYGQPDDKERSRVAGFHEHLIKPVDFELIRKLLDDYRAGLYRTVM